MRWLAPLVIVLVVFGEGFAAWHDSATDDEPAHIAAGFLRVNWGVLDFYPEQPPLPGMLATIPLELMPVSLGDSLSAGRDHWAVGKNLLYHSGNDADAMLFAARCTTIALFAILLASVYLFVARATRNRLAALAALALTAFCPTLLAHGRLATSDLAVTLFSFLAVMLFAEEGSRWRVIAAGALAGCAIVSKVSGLFLVGFLPLVALVRRRSIRDCVYAAGAALVVVELTYLPLLRDWYLQRAYGSTSLVTHLVAPFTEYAQHVKAIFGWVAHPYRAEMFLLGDFSRDGWWYYFPVALALKLPIAGLLLGLFALVRRNVASSFVILFLAVSMLTKTDIGVRYVLPLFPFLYTAVAIALHESSRHVQRAGAVLIAIFVVSSMASYPHDLAYFNELIRPSRADQYLIDSNLDWGQDLKRLAAWTKEHRVAHLRIHYFGGGDPRYAIPDAEPWPGPRVEPLPPGYFAVSRTFYRHSFAPRYPMNYAQYLARAQARFVTMIGRSILVYEVPAHSSQRRAPDLRYRDSNP